MITFTTIIYKFDTKGEKTGWTYIEIPADISQQLKPNNKKAYRVKGKLDDFSIAQVAVMPMGDGTFILPINATMRKGIHKKEGAMLLVNLEEDKSPIELDADFIMCLEDDEQACVFFKSLTKSHQQYFSKWIASAKTEETKAKRIAQSVNALSRSWGYPEMIRANKKTI
ncbi:MAG: DUF1905 domain-containing protein [Bacteroidia bacterium]|nr:DUF1905 domain-containing protein [Bacteroidia bacterium]